jgi:hypothetical protein
VVVAHHLFVAVSGVDGRFENLYSLAGKLGAAQTAYQFLGFAGEHRAAHHLYSARSACFACMVICYHGAKVVNFLKFEVCSL